MTQVTHLKPFMTSLLTEPLWRAEDLGKPIPDSPHAVSVALPLWQHAVGYEEADPAVVDAMALGYPRFVYHPLIVELGRKLLASDGDDDNICLPLPSLRAAEQACEYLGRSDGIEGRIVAAGSHGVYGVIASAEARSRLKAYWQHTGRIVSSRHAEAVLNRTPNDETAGAAAKTTLRHRLAEIYRVAPEDVFLYPTGMAAVTSAYEAALALAPDGTSLQFGFPYVDVLKVQEEFGPAPKFLAREGRDALAEATDFVAANDIASIVTETPANPLLRTADVAALAALAHGHGALLIVDDTVATGLNVDVTPSADLIATSLTKNFAGYGDVMGGAVIVSPRTPRAAEVRATLATQFEDLLWWADAVVLAERSVDFADRLAAINRNTLAVARFLSDHPAVEEVYYPGLGPDPNYEAIRRPNGGYGGLLSLLTVNAEATAAPVYDRLRISKGPSLGTDYSLCCPYTILAHYQELDWAESCGVSRWLMRVSIGLEDPEDIKARFAEALTAVE